MSSYRYLGVNKKFLCFIFFLVTACGYSMPQVKQGVSFFDDEKDRATSAADVKAIFQHMYRYIRAIVEKKSELILTQVDKESGANVDLKAPSSYSGVVETLNNKDGLLNRVYWQQVDEDIDSLQSILAGAGEIEINVHFYRGALECEVKLNFTDRPSLGVLSNAIYHKINGRWWLKRLL